MKCILKVVIEVESKNGKLKKQDAKVEGSGVLTSRNT